MKSDELLAILEGGRDGELPAEWERFFRTNYDFEREREAVLERYRGLLREYSRRFGNRAVRLARAPGRVNLIGEHTDYNGLPVFPMAVDRDLVAAFSPRQDGEVVLSNTDPVYGDRRFSLAPDLPPYATGDWGNYLKAGIQGVLDAWREQGRGPADPRGLQALISGNVPAAAGLSSSSALVVLAALMILEANGAAVGEADGAGLPGLELAGRLARAETYVGTQGGGMDQAASLLGRGGHALKIDFGPLRAEAVPLPGGCRFVVAHSLVRAAKTEGALDQYNRRSIECRLAVAVLNRTAVRGPGAPEGPLPSPIRLLGDIDPLDGQVAARVSGVLPDSPWSLEEIARSLELPVREVQERFCRRRDGSIFPQPPEGFKLRERVRHVLEEGLRVEEARRALRDGDLAGLGRLMDLSHESCRDLYEISCPELDRLVEIARGAGALGSRLTGAGFGGCTISLVAEERVEEFTEAVTRGYYHGFLGLRPTEAWGTAAGGRIFACRAVDGAGVVRVGSA